MISQHVAAKTAPIVAFKFAVSDAGKIAGYGSTFHSIDQHGERVLPGAFSKSIARHKVDGTAPLMLWQHRHDEPVGKWTEFSENDVGLRLSGEFTLSSSRGRDAYEHVKHGDLGGLSIGYREIVDRQNGDVRELLELDVLEVSIVSFPSNRMARISGVKFAPFEIERILRDAGVPKALALKILAGGVALRLPNAGPETACR